VFIYRLSDSNIGEAELRQIRSEIHFVRLGVNKILYAAWTILCLAGLGMSAGTWTEVRSKNFYVIGDAAEKEVVQMAARLEQFRGLVRRLFPQVKLDGGYRTNVIVFKNAASYLPFRPRLSDGTPDTGISGYFLAGSGVNYITLVAGEKPGAYGTIYHEYVHYLLDTNIGRSEIPPWLGEGLAEYLEMMHLQADGRSAMLGTPPEGHLALLKQNGLIPLKQFFSTDNSLLHRGGDSSRGWFYAQAWLSAHYLFHGGDTNGVELSTILTTARDAYTSEKAATLLFKSGLSELEEKLIAYIDLPKKTSAVALGKMDETAFRFQSAPLSESAVSAYLGDLQYQARRLPEAETLLRRAVQLEPRSTIANISLGLVLAQKKEFSESRRFIERALTDAPDNFMAEFAFAYGISRESLDDSGRVYKFPAENEAKMRRALLRSIELAPDFAESYRLLAFIDLVNDSNINEAAGLLQKALSIRPGDQDLELLLAKIYLRQEKYGDARTVAKKLTSTAANSLTWIEAHDILRTVEKYYAARSAGPADPELTKIFGSVPPLILKRSTLTDAQAYAYSEDREVTNLNLYIERPQYGEKQIAGYVDKISCTDVGLTYTIKAGGETFKLFSGPFAELSLQVLTEGERTFTFDCDKSFGNQLTVMIYEQAANPRPGIRGRLRSIAFVPSFFRIKSPEEMAARRTVIIEEDRPLKQRQSSQPN